MTNSRVSFPEKEVRAHWRNVFIVLFLLASPFILYISYIIWVEIAIPEFSAPKESVKVFHIPGGDIPTKRDISYYRSYWQSNYYTQVYVSELGYDETIALISRRSSECEMRDSDPSQRPFFVATPVMQCFQSALPEAYIAIEIQSLQERHLPNLNLDWLSEQEQSRLLELLEEESSKYQTVLFVTVNWGSYF